jgi:hypothetical protein
LIYTASFFTADTYPGEKRCIAVSQPRGFDFKRIIIEGRRPLEPDYSWVIGVNNGSLTQEQYTENYLNKLSQEHETLEKLMRFGQDKDIVLLCWEKAGEFCHRVLLVNYLAEELGFDKNLIRIF